jgi:hypothetical protein
MKTFAILFTLFYFLNALAVAPYGIKGQQQSQTLYSNVHQAPNNQVTNLGGIDALIETGNKNLLINPSFEHSTFSTGWTFSGTSNFFEDTSRNIDGKKAGGILAVTTSFALIQDSTLYATQFADGIQGLVSVRVKANNNATGIKVCSRSAGVTSTTNCVNVVANNKWGLYKVPVILGGISNGISIASTGNTTSSVFVEDAFVGAVDLQATVDASKIAGSSYFTGSVNPTVSTEAVFSNAGVNAPTLLLSSLGQWQTNDSDAIQQTINNLPAGCYRAEFTHLVAHSTTAAISYNTCITENGTESSCVNGTKSFSNQPSQGTNNTKTTRDICFSQQGNRTFALRGASASGTIFATVTTGTVNFSLYYFNSSNTYSSTNADTDWADGGTITITGTTSNPTKGTTTRDKVWWKRHGDRLLLRYEYAQSTAGTAGSGDYLFSVPSSSGCTVDSSKIGFNTTIGANSGANNYNVIGAASAGVTGSSAGVGYSTAYSATQIRAVLRPSSTSVTQSIGSTFYGLDNSIVSYGIEASVPCVGWQQSNIIIGQFNGLESCANTLECTDTFSAKVSATGVVSEENVDWISGNFSPSAGLFTASFVSGIFTVAPNCVVATQNTSTLQSDAIMYSTSNTQAVVQSIARGTAGITSTAYPFNIICQKQGVDYVGKTAKAVASSQNTRIPGVDKAVQYVEEITCGSTSSLVRSLSGSSMFQSLGNISSGNCSFTLKSNLFTGEPYCFTTFAETTTQAAVLYPVFSTATTGTLQCRSGTSSCTAGGDFNITCLGVSP